MPPRPICSERLVQVLRRLANTDRCMHFTNEDEDIRFYLYAKEQASGRFEASIYLGEQPTILHIRELELDVQKDDDGYYDDNVLLYGKYTIRRDDSRQLTKLRDVIHECMRLRICACKKAFVYDEEDLCCFCLLTATADDLRKQFCSICLEHSCQLAMKKTSCCGNFLHRKCYEKLPDGKCPYCRHQLFTVPDSDDDDDDDDEDEDDTVSDASSEAVVGSNRP